MSKLISLAAPPRKDNDLSTHRIDNTDFEYDPQYLGMEERFQRAFGDIIRCVPWGDDENGVVAAGGACWRTLINQITPGCDLDLFVYGESAEKRAVTVLDVLCTMTAKSTKPLKFDVYSSVITITGFAHPVQLICSQAKDAFEVVDRFDMTHLQICYQASTGFVVTLPAQLAINSGETKITRDVSIDRLNKAYRQGVKFSTRDTRQIYDQFWQAHYIEKFKWNPDSAPFAKPNSQWTGKSPVIAFNKVHLEADFTGEHGYRFDKSAKLVRAIDWEYIKGENIEFTPEKAWPDKETGKISQVQYMDQDLLVQLPQFRAMTVQPKCHPYNTKYHWVSAYCLKPKFVPFLKTLPIYAPGTDAKDRFKTLAERHIHFEDNYQNTAKKFRAPDTISLFFPNDEFPGEGDIFTGQAHIQYFEESRPQRDTKERHWKIIVQKLKICEKSDDWAQAEVEDEDETPVPVLAADDSEDDLLSGILEE